MSDCTFCETAYDSDLADENDVDVLAAIASGVMETRFAKRVAGSMIDEFGNLQGVFAAGRRELHRCDGASAELIEEVQRLKHLIRKILRQRIRNRSLLEDTRAVENYFRARLQDSKQEQLHGLFLDTGFRLIADECLQTGTVDHVSVYPREIVSHAIEHTAKHLILVHNHPSGSAKPGMADIMMTNDLVVACSYFGIHLADHLIISRDGCFSFRQNNLIDVERLSSSSSHDATEQIQKVRNV